MTRFRKQRQGLTKAVCSRGELLTLTLRNSRVWPTPLLWSEHSRRVQRKLHHCFWWRLARGLWWLSAKDMFWQTQLCNSSVLCKGWVQRLATGRRAGCLRLCSSCQGFTKSVFSHTFFSFSAYFFLCNELAAYLYGNRLFNIQSRK